MVKKKKNYWKQSILYGLFVVLVAGGVNYIFEIKSVQDFLASSARFWYLDILFFDFLNITDPYLQWDKLFFLKDWLWLLPYFVMAALVGGVHSYIFEKRLGFANIVLSCVSVYVFQLLVHAAPYGVMAIFIYFFDFIKKFYLESLWIVPACFIGLFFGTESVVIWIKNSGGEKLMERYR